MPRSSNRLLLMAKRNALTNQTKTNCCKVNKSASILHPAVLAETSVEDTDASTGI